MVVGYTPPDELTPVPGVRLAAVSAGIKYAERPDLVVMELDAESTVAGVFTKNAFCAAPVQIARRHLAATSPRFFLVNSGNANAGTGKAGEDASLACCKALADMAGCTPEQVLPFSTGVIGEPLPVTRIVTSFPDAIDRLEEAGWLDAARGIMTTDTVAKGTSCQLILDNNTITITGIAKGAGMIRPDMATMLAYVATDARIDVADLQRCLNKAVARSFNRITVDGDTSTNDACMLVATGRSGVAIGPAEADRFQTTLDELCMELAQAIVRDGEGATRFVTVQVEQARTEEECRQVAYTIAHSPLVKTALFAGDPNWGRVLAAVGRAGIENLDIEAVQIFLGDICIVRNGARAEDYTETAGQKMMAGKDVLIRVQLGRGDAQDTVWTTDLSCDYVKINAEYRT